MKFVGNASLWQSMKGSWVLGLILVFAFAVAAQAQNLVPNPSFETFTSCPTGLSGSGPGPTLTPPWSLPTGGSSDYYNACAGSSSAVPGVPANDFGNQAARTGNAYAGFILRPSTGPSSYREYIEVQLTAPLVAGMTYQVSFYVSLSDQSQWAIDKVGAYLKVGSVGPVNNALPLPPPVVPQIVNPTGNYITDKTGWTLVTGTYVALGGEDHLVIGNFADNSLTTPVTGLGGFYPGAYYYLDDVTVICCVQPPSNMTNWWPLDEQTGAVVVANIVNSANNGTPVPGPIGPPDPSTRPAPTTPPPPTVTPPAMVGGALYFYGQGPSGFVQVPSTGTLNIGNGDFTIDAWIYPIQVGQDVYQPIVDKLNVGAKTGYSLYIRSPGAAGNARLEFVWGNGTVMLPPVQSISPIAYAQWHHVAVTFKRLVPVNPGDPSFEIKMYVNGASAGAQSGAPSGGVGTIANTLALLIGGTRANTGTGQSFPLGEIALDEVELFDRALDQSEIQAIANAGSAGKCKPCVPPPSGMVSWWPGDGNANDIVDGNTGTLQDNATHAAGQVGLGFLLDGQGDFVRVPHNANLDPGTGSFTVDAWIRTSQAPATGVLQYIVSKYECGGNCPPSARSLYAIYLENGVLHGIIRNTSAGGPDTNGTHIVEGSTSLATNTFYHVAMVRDIATSNVILYVNGAIEASEPINAGSSGVITDDDGENDPFDIGAIRTSGSTNSQQFFAGVIDEVEFFNVALPQSDIQAIYNAGSAGKCKKFVILGVTPSSPTTNPFDVTYAVNGCFGQEMFLVLDASAAPNAVPSFVPFPLSYLDTSGAWQPWPTPLSLITPWMSSGPADGLYTLFSGSVPTGQYTLYLGCDFVPNGHLDIDANLNVNGVYDALNVTVQ